MAKSIDDILRRMQQENQQRMIQEQQRIELANRQRQEWIQRNRMYEKAFNPSSAASAAAGAGGGSGNRQETKTTLLALSISQNPEFASPIPNVSLKYLTEDGTLSPTETQPFNGLTVLCNCSDDPDYIYYVTSDGFASESAVSFGKINKQNLSRTELDISTTLESFYTSEDENKRPAALYYEGNNQFIYFDSSRFYQVVNEPNIRCFRITLNAEGLVDSIVFVTTVNFAEGFELVSFDWITAAIPFNNSIYISKNVDSFFTEVATIDIEDSGATTPIDMPYFNPDTLPEGITNTKIWYLLDLIYLKNEVISSIIFTDKDTFTALCCIGKVNLDTLEVSYYIPLSVPDVEIITSLAVI